MLEGPHEFLNSKVWPKLFRGYWEPWECHPSLQRYAVLSTKSRCKPKPLFPVANIATPRLHHKHKLLQKSTVDSILIFTHSEVALKPCSFVRGSQDEPVAIGGQVSLGMLSKKNADCTCMRVQVGSNIWHLKSHPDLIHNAGKRKAKPIANPRTAKPEKNMTESKTYLRSCFRRY